MALRYLLVAALCAVLALPALAEGRDNPYDETEPDTEITKVKVSPRKAVAKVSFEGSDPVDAPEDLDFDCYLDGGEDEGEEDEEGEDEDEFAAARGKDSNGVTEWGCASPWTVKNLDPGTHTVEVIAFDEEFNEDLSPAEASFRVKKK